MTHTDTRYGLSITLGIILGFLLSLTVAFMPSFHLHKTVSTENCKNVASVRICQTKDVQF